MTNLLDEGIDCHQSMIGHMGTVVRTLFHGTSIPKDRQYHRPIDSPKHLECNLSIAADSVRRATLQKTRQEAGRLSEVKALEDERAA